MTELLGCNSTQRNKHFFSPYYQQAMLFSGFIYGHTYVHTHIYIYEQKYMYVKQIYTYTSKKREQGEKRAVQL